MGWVSHDCKVDLGTIRGHLTGDQYIRDVLQPVVVPHFDSHSLARRPVYGWHRQAASFKGSNSLPSKWSCDCSSMASHEPGFESDRECLGPVVNWKLHCIENGGSYHSRASDDWLEGWDGGLRASSSTWWVHSILNFEPWMSLRDSKLTFSRWYANLIVHYKLWMWIWHFLV